MKTFRICAAQGELDVIRLGDLPRDKRLPEGYASLEPVDGVLIVGESETHHYHVLDAAHVTCGVLDEPDGMRILRLIVEQPTALIHQRSHDTHEPLLLAPGEYEIRPAREYDPYAELARMVAD